MDDVNRRVHRFDAASGSLDGGFGGKGDGPGEFASTPFAVQAQDGLIAVVDSRRITYFEPDGDEVARNPFPKSDFFCVSGKVAGFVGRGVVASPKGLLMVLRCLGTGTASSLVDRVIWDRGDGRGVVLASRPLSDGRTLDFEYSPVLASYQDGFLFGGTSDDCLDHFNFEGNLIGGVCHNWIRQIAMPNWLVDSLATRAQNRIGDIVVRGRSFPRFGNVFALGNGALVYSVPVSADSPDLQLLVHDRQGGERPLPAPAAPHIFAGARSILAAWPHAEGTQVAIVTLDGRTVEAWQ